MLEPPTHGVHIRVVEPVDDVAVDDVTQDSKTSKLPRVHVTVEDTTAKDEVKDGDPDPTSTHENADEEAMKSRESDVDRGSLQPKDGSNTRAAAQKQSPTRAAAQQQSPTRAAAQQQSPTRAAAQQQSPTRAGVLLPSPTEEDAYVETFDTGVQTEQSHASRAAKRKTREPKFATSPKITYRGMTPFTDHPSSDPHHLRLAPLSSPSGQPENDDARKKKRHHKSKPKHPANLPSPKHDNVERKQVSTEHASQPTTSHDKKLSSTSINLHGAGSHIHGKPLEHDDSNHLQALGATSSRYHKHGRNTPTPSLKSFNVSSSNETLTDLRESVLKITLSQPISAGVGKTVSASTHSLHSPTSSHHLHAPKPPPTQRSDSTTPPQGEAESSESVLEVISEESTETSQYVTQSSSSGQSVTSGDVSASWSGSTSGQRSIRPRTPSPISLSDSPDSRKTYKGGKK